MSDRVVIVLWGPGLSGKSTNLEVIREVLLGSAGSGGLRVIEQGAVEGDPDELFLELLDRAGEGLEVKLVAPPGQLHYRDLRRAALSEVSGVVFVADSSASAVAVNLAALDELELFLAGLHRELGELPLVFQFNKRDLRDALDVPRLDELLNAGGRPSVEAVTRRGVGVFPTLKLILREVRAEAERVFVPDGVRGPSPWSEGDAAGARPERSEDSWREQGRSLGLRSASESQSSAAISGKWRSSWLIAFGVLGGALSRELWGLIKALQS